MACIGVCRSFLGSGSRVFQSSFVAVVLVAAMTVLGTRPAQAQNVDTWKSVAIIGGATAAGAYIGHKVGGRTGALVGAGIGGAPNSSAHATTVPPGSLTRSHDPTARGNDGVG